MNEQKWCSYCRKNNHNDAECWSTRIVPSVSPEVAVAVDFIKYLERMKWGKEALEHYDHYNKEAPIWVHDGSMHGRWINGKP